MGRTTQSLTVFCTIIELIGAIRILEPPEYYPGPGSCGCENEAYSPVCADGKTYNNHCQLDCSLRREYRSARTLTAGPCHEKENSHEHVHTHERPPSCVCTMDYRPVCGSDGKTYSNGCALRCAARNDPYLTQLRSGSCETDDNQHYEEPECYCGAENNPICGNDGRTYDNYCHFRCHSKRKNHRTLRIQHEGACPQPRPYLYDRDHDEPQG